MSLIPLALKPYGNLMCYEESILGTRCNSSEDMQRDICNGNKTVMGYAAPHDSKGIYNFHTSCEKSDNMKLTIPSKCMKQRPISINVNKINKKDV